eukprot:GHVU01227140.1.p1 GENE.GHVU01227140.1~~GHVU01227140.1.p1  ORF type:complete len:133 (-),score=8.41 GHVU01227140.1:819-1217(-)
MHACGGSKRERQATCDPRGPWMARSSTPPLFPPPSIPGTYIPPVIHSFKHLFGDAEVTEGARQSAQAVETCGHKRDDDSASGSKTTPPDPSNDTTTDKKHRVTSHDTRLMNTIIIIVNNHLSSVDRPASKQR